MFRRSLALTLKIRKNFLKVEIPTISEFVRKIAICCSSHILRINLRRICPKT